MSESFQSSFQFGTASSARRRDPDEPMRILIVGSFSGDQSADSETDITDRKIKRVDIDNFGDLLSKKRPTVRLPLGDRTDLTIDVVIGDMDDFHPDSLYRNLPVFQELRDLRKQLLDSSTFADAAARLRKAMPLTPNDNEPGEAAATNPAGESDSDTLARILGASSNPSAAGATANIQSLIDSIVAPYVIPSADPRRDEYVASVDAAVASQMRSVLHNASFQSLEAAWRGLHYIVSSVATTEELKIFLWDVTKNELIQASESESLQDSLLFKRLVTQRDQEPWSMLVSDLSFGKSLGDLVLLSRLGAIASQSGGPLLASASAALLNAQSWTDELNVVESDGDLDSQNWQAVRTSPVAKWIGLSGPRFMLRLPYGSATNEIDSFAFEEVFDPQSEHNSFLWGASSIFTATLLATSFLESQWQMSPDDNLELDDFPMVTYTDDGDKHLKACAETYIPERTAESMLDVGIMPLMSYKNRNAIRLLRFQSIAEPATGLRGPWT